MATEKEMKKCSDCKYNRPLGEGCGGICALGYGTLRQAKGGLPFAYNFSGRPACEHAVFNSTTDKRLTKIEKRLDVLEKTEQIETSKKPEVLVEIFKFIADTYTQEEIDIATQLMKDVISKAEYEMTQEGDIYHNFTPWKRDII